MNVYLGKEEALREVHARYSDINARLKIMWGVTSISNHGKNEKEKVIECRRTHIVEDTLAEIDEDFINLPIKIKF